MNVAAYIQTLQNKYQSQARGLTKPYINVMTQCSDGSSG